MKTQFLVVTLDPKERKCSFCDNAKKLLDKRNKLYHEVYHNSSELEAILSDLKFSKKSIKTYPQIFDLDLPRGKEHIGGFSDLMKYLNK